MTPRSPRIRFSDPSTEESEIPFMGPSGVSVVCSNELIRVCALGALAVRNFGLGLNFAPELHSPDLLRDLFDGQSGKPLLPILRVVTNAHSMQVKVAKGIGNSQLAHNPLQ